MAKLLQKLNPLFLTSFIFLFTQPVKLLSQDTLRVNASKDNTLYESTSGSLSNGNGVGIFSGRTQNGDLRRAVIKFELDNILSSGATINDVFLNLRVTRARGGNQPMNLHRLNTDWGEGNSTASGQGGGGTNSATGDATWIHTFFSGNFWTNPGGDFNAVSSATQGVAGNGSYTWTSAQLLSDVQFFRFNPNQNFGWIFIGNENVNRSAKRFASRENSNNQPELLLIYTSAEPTQQASNLTFSNISSNSYSLQFSAPISVPDGYLVLRSKGNAPNAVPADGVRYNVGDAIGNSVVVSRSNSLLINETGLDEGSRYFYEIYAYNGNFGVDYLTVNPLSGDQCTNSDDSISVSACFSYTSPAGNTYTNSGNYIDTFTNGVGCDSLVFINLSINNNTGTESIVACDSFTWAANGQTYTQSNTIIDTLTNSAGCDSIVTLNLTINNFSTGSESIAACDSYTWPANGQTYNASGTQTAILTNSSGCDSIVTLNLTINNSTSSNISASICNGETLLFGTQTLNSSGTYSEVFQAANGCDSIVNLSLNVNTVDTSISVNNNTLTANASVVSYQWIDCNNGNSQLIGDTLQSFTPSQSGSYAVIVTDNGCSDTSNCYDVLIIGLSNEIISDIRIFPNPVQDKLFVYVPGAFQITRVSIVTLTGREVRPVRFKELKKGIDTSILRKGMYHLVLEGEGFRKELKFLKD